MEKGDKQYILIEKAYENYKEWCNNYADKHISRIKCLDEFKKNIELWDGISSLDDIIEKYLTGTEADNVAAIGQGTNYKDFKIFMNNDTTKKAIKELLEIKKNIPLRKNGKIDFTVISKIQKVEILGLLENYVAKENRPTILVNRFLCMLFDEVFTSIANASSALEIAAELGCTSGNKYNKAKNIFILQQYEIRYKIDEYFSLKGEEVDNIVKFIVPWHITNVK